VARPYSSALFHHDVFEIGGKNKTFKQIKELQNSYLVIDIDYTTDARKRPLWLFGMMP
jgi:hypothetical protein